MMSEPGQEPQLLTGKPAASDAPPAALPEIGWALRQAIAILNRMNDPKFPKPDSLICEPFRNVCTVSSAIGNVRLELKSDGSTVANYVGAKNRTSTFVWPKDSLKIPESVRMCLSGSEEFYPN